MKMNKVYILGLALLSLLFSSCEDWLDMPSESKYDSSSVFESVGRAEMAVMACYTNTFNRELYYQLGMGTDECMSTEGDTNSKNQMANYVYTTSNIPTSTYNALYAGIEYANVCIKKLTAMKTGSSEADQQKIDYLLGESYAVRGMNYLNIVRFFGDVPYPTKPVEDMDTFTSSRVPRDTIYDGIIKDLQAATELLPWLDEGVYTTPERFTKNAAYGILARTALYAAGYSLRFDLNTYDPASVRLAQREDQNRIAELYQIASNACYQIIQHGQNHLVENYEDVFRDLMNGRYNDESILELGQYGANVNDYSIGYTNGIYAHPNCMYQKAKPAMQAIPSYYFDFEEGDVRRDVTICNYDISSDNIRKLSTFSGLTIGKFRVDWTSELGVKVNKRDINWPVLRYSDVLLMYAEAENEINGAPSNEAVEALKEVRMRAFNNDEAKVGTIPTAYSNFKDAIIKERKLELGFETLRRTDLIRWGIHYETLTGAKQKVIDIANHTGNYTNVDLYRAYLPVAATDFEDALVAVDYISYKTELSETEIADLEAQGYVVLDMFSADDLSNGKAYTPDQVWIESLFRGLEKEKVELLPLNQKMIDVNPGLEGQQHPLY
ncbi:RagB/SusD family nutrient uptake outer membrane protein [Plebeiibacterium sediminum]|uniref:RagB/SusD family nutrient uptake outer membrane protein n=1 Tax=Plebeiibacterium sediminum TaxID=2992112 RepID=A0AAE3SEV4_9BACT|nr:RagB/SusD family nutrient uptake outer membrane protein [Plebeiobacterium sediminum]MCW3786586.1 RagB/SusD family nutrient uptake outer membrane protein [Plebeiobacterium sediminum]